MRILLVSHFFSTHGGGIEIVAGQLCAQWRCMGHDVLWAASDADRPPELEGVEPAPLRSFNFVERATGLPMPVLSFAAMRKLGRLVRASDVVVIHDSLYLTSILAMLAANRARKPTILVQHIAEIAFANVLLRKAMKLANILVTRPMLRAAGGVAFISATTREFYADLQTRKPPTLVFNGVDNDLFYYSSVPPLSERAAFGIPAGMAICLFVGRFVEKKGLAILRNVAESRPDLHFVFAGRGPIDPAQWGIKNVTVCRNVPHSSLAKLYRAADFLLLPSVGEGYPLVIQEAMACGLPVICGDESAKADPDASRWLSGVPVTLDDPSGSARLVIAAIDALNMSQDERSAMAGYARRTYSWKKMAEQVLQLQQA